jgi:hypothetical protein
MDYSVDIRNYFDITDNTPYWHDIQDFPGYQIANDYRGIWIRSFKRYKVFPYGSLVKYKVKNSVLLWILTNSNNQRVEVSYNDLINNNLISNISYPTYSVIITGRNNRSGIIPDSDSYIGKKISNPRHLKVDKEKLSFPDFSNLGSIDIS